MHVFRYFGLPYIIHSDRGREFVNDTITSVVKEWTGSCKIVHGKPRSPWVQGLVERTNACVEDMISTKQTDLNCNEWASWLPEIQCKYKLSSVDFMCSRVPWCVSSPLSAFRQ